MKKLLKGNHTCAEAVMLSDVQVISAYPITPQTPVVEKLSFEKDRGNLKAEMVLVESEHSAITVCIAASATGVRVFTATSANGLALMHEQLHWAAGSRLPIVLAAVNRGMAAPWTIWNDHQDTMSQRDTGWIQIHCETNQEIFDTIIQAFKIAETERIPVMVCYDGFILSEVAMPVDILEKSVINKFLPAPSVEPLLDVNNPGNVNPVVTPIKRFDNEGVLQNNYFGFRKNLQEDLINSINSIKKINNEYKSISGHQSDLLFSTYKIEDSDLICIAAGSIASELKDTVNLLRNENIKAGVISLKLFRPFPADDLVSVLNKNQKIIIFDKSISYGYEGPLLTEIKAALYSQNLSNKIQGIITGLGGFDVKSKSIFNIIKKILTENYFNKKYLYLNEEF